MSTYVREVAKRMFAKEFRNSDLSFREGDDVYSPQYLLTPTGARVNRLFIVGTLIEKENIGMKQNTGEVGLQILQEPSQYMQVSTNRKQHNCCQNVILPHL